MEEIKHLTEEEIALCSEAIAEGKVSSLPAHMQDHLQLCDSCFHEASMVAELLNDEQLNPLTINKTIPFPKTGLWLAVAASLAILIMLAIVYPGKLFNNKQISDIQMVDSINMTGSIKPAVYINQEQTILQTQEKENLVSVPSQNKLEPQEKTSLIGSNMLAFAPHPDMEKLVSRSANGTLRGDDLQIITAIEWKTISGQLKLEWKNEESALLYIEIFDNQGQTIFKTETNGNFISLNTITRPGRYYWKLLNEDFDLLFCGVIIIEK